MATKKKAKTRAYQGGLGRPSNAELRTELYQKHPGMKKLFRSTEYKADLEKLSKKNEKVFNAFMAGNSRAFGETVVDRVDEAMAVQELTARQLAARCGITNPAYQGSWWWTLRWRVLNQHFNPQFVTVCRLAKALDVNVWELFDPFKD